MKSHTVRNSQLLRFAIIHFLFAIHYCSCVHVLNISNAFFGSLDSNLLYKATYIKRTQRRKTCFMWLRAKKDSFLLYSEGWETKGQCSSFKMFPKGHHWKNWKLEQFNYKLEQCVWGFQLSWKKVNHFWCFGVKFATTNAKISVNTISRMETPKWRLTRKCIALHTAGGARVNIQGRMHTCQNLT